MRRKDSSTIIFSFQKVTNVWVVRPLRRVQLSRAMFGSPISHRIQNGLQRQTIFCQGVINARRHLPKYLTANNSVSFQFTQLLGQHLLGVVRDVTLKLAKPISAKTPDVVQDYRFPFPLMMSMVVRTGQFLSSIIFMVTKRCLLPFSERPSYLIPTIASAIGRSRSLRTCSGVARL